MKKFIVVALSVIMFISLSGCSFLEGVDVNQAIRNSESSKSGFYSTPNYMPKYNFSTPPSTKPNCKGGDRRQGECVHQL